MAGERQKPEPVLNCVDAHEARWADVGETGSDVSRSARRQAWEQYASPDVCRSQARQKSGDQSISIILGQVGGMVGMVWCNKKCWARQKWIMVFE